MSDLKSFLKPEFQERRTKIEDVTSGGLILEPKPEDPRPRKGIEPRSQHKLEEAFSIFGVNSLREVVVLDPLRCSSDTILEASRRLSPQKSSQVGGPPESRIFTKPTRRYSEA